MAGRASFANTTATAGTVAVKIKKSPFGTPNAARQIRNAILRDYFSYTENDIKELGLQKLDKFFI